MASWSRLAPLRCEALQDPLILDETRAHTNVAGLLKSTARRTV